MPQNSGCTGCSLHRTTTNVCVWGSGNPHADIMLVGEAPGAEEEKNGRPFVGQAGAVLDEALARSGLKRDDLYIANTVKCRPPQNRDPKAEEVVACSAYLLEEIEAVNPKVIVVLGNFALGALTGKRSITKERGKPLEPKINTSATIIGTMHPASALYSNGEKNKQLIADDLRTAKTLAYGSKGDHDFVVVYPVDEEPVLSSEAIATVKLLSRAPTLFVDLEWTANDKKGDSMVWPWSNRGGEVYSISITGLVDGHYHTLAVGLQMDPRLREAIQRFLSNIPVVFHNASADMLWIAQQSFRKVKLGGDTMVLAHLLDENQELSLEAVSGRYGDVPGGWKGVYYMTRPAGQLAWQRLLEYNAMDTYATAKAWYGLLRQIDTLPPDRKEKVLRLHNLLVIPGMKELIGSAYLGVPIDEGALIRGREMVTHRRDDTAVRLAELIGSTPMQAAKLAGSPQQTTAYIKRTLGLEIESSRQDDLKELIDYPAIEEIINWRKDAKLINAYFDPWAKLLARQGDGRLHTMYKLTGTRTGRLSTQGEGGGTLHTAPHEDWVRELIAAAPGRKIVAADYSQIELRVLSWQANEPTMQEFYRAGEDLHSATAAFIKAAGEMGGGLSLTKFWDDRHAWIARIGKPDRQNAKGANFGLSYGMMTKKFRTYAKTKFGVSLTMEEAEFIRTSFFQLYARLLPWHEEIMSFARRTGYVTTPFGRQLAIDANDAHVAINTPIQSIASDMTLLAISRSADRVRAEGLRGHVIGFVHDSIIYDVHEEDAHRVAAILKETMETLDTSAFGFKIPVPLVADLKIGASWAA